MPPVSWRHAPFASVALLLAWSHTLGKPVRSSGSTASTFDSSHAHFGASMRALTVSAFGFSLVRPNRKVRRSSAVMRAKRWPFRATRMDSEISGPVKSPFGILNAKPLSGSLLMVMWAPPALASPCTSLPNSFFVVTSRTWSWQIAMRTASWIEDLPLPLRPANRVTTVSSLTLTLLIPSRLSAWIAVIFIFLVPYGGAGFPARLIIRLRRPYGWRAWLSVVRFRQWLLALIRPS